MNKSLADKVTAWYQVNDFRGRVLCLMGCYSHRLNLAVERLYRYEYSEYYKAVKKLNVFVSEIRGSIKHRLKITSVFKKAIIRANDTRWNTQYYCIERSLEWIPLINNCGLPRQVLNMAPTAGEMDQLRELMAILEECKEVSIWLQNKDPLKVSLWKAREMFDELIAEYPTLKSHLAANADIVHNPLWESAIVKLQKEEEHLITKDEKKILRMFKPDATTVDNDAPRENGGFVARVLNSISNKKQKVSGYRSVNHV